MSRRKTYRFRVSIQEEAIDDLDRIYAFVFRDSPSRARKFIRQLQKKILSLRDLPRRGSRVPLLEYDEQTGQIRFIEHQGYLIFYTVHQKEVLVLHVTGPGQDWMQLFL